MSITPNRSIIIVGAGPFMSRSLSFWLASQDWKIVLISRSFENLDAYAEEITQKYPSSPKILTHVADVSDSQILISALDWAAEQLGGSVDVLAYNAANVGPCDLMTANAEDMDLEFKVTAIGTLLAGQWFVRHANTSRISEGEYPVFLVTGGVLDKHPYPSYSVVSATKSASQNITRQFAQILPENHNILVGMPLLVEPIIPLPGGGWATKSNPDSAVEKIFKPFFMDRENIVKNGKEFSGWTQELVW
jgi:NAD(P)-dependent dehydrogenase (short-subunit alcohol dehydrogenase family)